MTADALFAEPAHIAPPAHDYPAPELVHGEHEVPVWGLVDGGEEPVEVMAAGHGADSRDAVRHYLTAEHEYDELEADALLDRDGVSQWVVFVSECGCTDDQHAAHRHEQDHDTPYRTCTEATGNSDCSRLAPCAFDHAAFITRRADATTPHAVPVTVADLR